MTKHTDSREIEEEQWRPATRMVRGGTRRSAHGETSEAMFLTSGYVYDGPAEAEARFKG
ncbi:MAG: O-succinylhomoserine sulfhydrylase, partial [Alphaproteobacteria bacterium]|nr:O-succinylhomoserine sulfhydrylase [Alphaproteobacteria bacterium]